MTEHVETRRRRSSDFVWRTFGTTNENIGSVFKERENVSTGWKEIG